MNETIDALAVELRNLSDSFNGEDTPNDVIRTVLEQHISEIKGYETAVSEKQESLQEQLIGYTVDDDNSAMEGLSPAEQKQAELRERFGGR